MSPRDSKQTRIEVNFANVPSDCSLWKNCFYYNPKDRYHVWRSYQQCGSYQLVDHTFSQREFEKNTMLI